MLAAALAAPAGAAHAATPPAALPETHTSRPAHLSGTTSARVSADLAALGRAKAAHRAVTVTANTTQTSLTVAQPNGTFTMTLSPAPVRVNVGGRWRPISTTLHRTVTGRWTPTAVPSGLTLSGGGTGPLAVMTSTAGGQLSLSFPARLPAPVISGGTATYRSVLPGADLQVSATDTGGINEVLIVHNAAAAANPTLRHLRLGLTTRGLNVTADAAGNLHATSPGGRVEFSGPPPLAWNSAHHAAPRHHLPAEIQVASLPAGPGYGAAAAPVHPQLTSHTLALTPSARVLSSSTTAYPVYLGASITASPSNCDTVGSQNEECQAGFVETQGGPGCQTHQLYDQQQGLEGYEGNAIGFDPGFTGGCAPGEDRSFYAFNTSGLSTSMHIINATLTAWNTFGADFNCNDTHPVRVKLTGEIHPDTDWINQPDVNSANQTQEQDPKTGPNPDPNQNPHCDEQVPSFSGMGYALTMAAAQSWPVATFGFFGGSDSLGKDWLRIGDYPNIVTTFDITPDPPTSLTTVPAPQDTPGGATDNGCGAAPASYGWIGSNSGGTSPLQLSVGINSKISGEPVRAVYSATDDTTGTAIANPAGSDFNEDSGSKGPYSFWYSSGSATTHTGINFNLADGHTYSWSAQNEVEGIPGSPGYPEPDPYDSAPSQTCGFKVDLTPPTQPTVTSTAFPPSGSPPGQDAGTSGTFSFTSTDPQPVNCTGTTGCQASGVYEFEYALFPQQLPVTPIQPGCSDGSTTGAVLATNLTGVDAATATSCAIPVSQWGTNTLYVAAIDKAGNVSQAYDYTFYAPWNPTTKVTLGDITGDGIPDLVGTTSTDLIYYPGNADPATSPKTASSVTQTPDGFGWNTYQVTHRGSMSQSGIDDLFAWKGADLYLYTNQGGKSGQFTKAASHLITFTTHPACSSTITDCTGYATGDWSHVTQILAPGDAWCPASGASCSASDTGLPSLLTVENSGQLWLYQGGLNDTLQSPVKLGNAGGSTTWAGMTLIAPGPVNGQLTIWARDNATGTIYSYPITLNKNTGIPTINPDGSHTPVSATSGPTISGVSLPAATYPTLASPGPLDGDTTGTNDPGSYPGLYTETTTGTAPSGASCATGCLWYYPGQSTSNGTQPPLASTPSFVGVLKNLISQLS